MVPVPKNLQERMFVSCRLVAGLFVLAKQFPIFTVLLLGNTQIRVFSRGHVNLKQRRKRNPFVGERAGKQRKVWAERRCGMVWQ